MTLRQFSVGFKNEFSILFICKPKGTRVFQWQEDINVIVIIALSRTKVSGAHLGFLEDRGPNIEGGDKCVTKYKVRIQQTPKKTEHNAVFLNFIFTTKLSTSEYKLMRPYFESLLFID